MLNVGQTREAKLAVSIRCPFRPLCWFYLKTRAMSLLWNSIQWLWALLDVFRGWLTTFSCCRLHSTVNNMPFFWCVTHKDSERARPTNRRLCVFLLSFPVITRLSQTLFDFLWSRTRVQRFNRVSPPNFIEPCPHPSRPRPSKKLHVDLYLEIFSSGKIIKRPLPKLLQSYPVATVAGSNCFFFFRKVSLKPLKLLSSSLVYIFTYLYPAQRPTADPDSSCLVS